MIAENEAKYCINHVLANVWEYMDNRNLMVTEDTQNYYNVQQFEQSRMDVRNWKDSMVIEQINERGSFEEQSKEVS